MKAFLSGVHSVVSRLGRLPLVVRVVLSVFFVLFALNTVVTAFLGVLVGGGFGGFVWQVVWCGVWVYLVVCCWLGGGSVVPVANAGLQDDVR